ncbi:MAG: ABC transporter substrate-binding protein [Neisseria sp.]|nr:ABC transporter substrate-binding protein [Neisseria sp.]
MKKVLFASVLAAFAMNAYAQKIVVMSPDVADVVVALGATNEIVGRDQTTTNPALKNKKIIGVFRQLTPEPIMALKPNLAVGSWMVQPVNIYSTLQKAGIKAVNVAPDDSIAAYPQSIREIGKLIGKTQQANALANKWQAQMKQLPATGKRVIFSYDGRLVAGRNTAADEIIKRAGAINAAADIDGMKPLTREAWIRAKPDVIVVADHNAKVLGGVQTFAVRAEIATTPAAKNNRIYLWPANDMFRYGLDTPQVLKRVNGLAK